MKTKFLGGAGRFRQGLERLSRGLRHWRDDRRGAIAVQFAFLVVPLTVLAFGLIDLNRMNTQKHNLQDSLDAAALYAARSSATTDAALDAQGDKALLANLQLMPGAQLLRSEFKQVGVQVIADAEIKVPAVVSNLWTNEDLIVKVHTEVNRNAKNVEVALVLDITGSMAGQPIIDLRSAATELVDIVVKPQQTPFYSKVAVVPYSMGVNAGSYAVNARGAIPGPKSISGASWWKSGSSQKNVTKINRASTATVTSNGHGFSNGDWVYLWNVGSPMADRGYKAYKVINKSTNDFQLEGLNTTGLNNDATSGYVRACQTTNCDVVLTVNSHGFNTNDNVRITGVQGGSDFTSRINDITFGVTRLSANTIQINGLQAKAAPTYPNFTYTSGGSAYCTVYGCEYFYFQNADNGAWRTHQVSTCVSERTTNAYTDVSPATTPVGLNYPAPNGSGNECLGSTIFPLSSDKVALKAQIADLKDKGSTAGHIGVAWGWYMVSPNFASFLPAASRPGSYTAPDMMKVVIWMTDGANNTAYCKGVISADSTSGSGSAADHINCNAPNGSSSAQTLALCTAMKQAGVTVYSVGFNIAGNTPAQTIVNSCATSANHVYMANGGTALKDAFAAIGHEIDNLRLSK